VKANAKINKKFYNDSILLKEKFLAGSSAKRKKNFALPVNKEKRLVYRFEKRDSFVRKLKFPIVFRNNSENKTNYLNHSKSALNKLS